MREKTFKNLNEQIENKRKIVNELEQDNQKVEILSLLKEFCIIDTYDSEPITASATTDKEVIAS